MISFIMTSLDRGPTLKTTVDTLRAKATTPFELIIADDGSQDETKRIINELRPGMAIFNPKRSGLGANMNRGIAAAGGDYHFILQDDFAARFNLDKYLQLAISALERFQDIDLIRFGSLMDSVRWFPDIHKKSTRKTRLAHVTEERRQINGHEIVVVTAKNPKVDVFVYSDNPHLRRSDFCAKYGSYKENVKTSETEIDFMRRYNANGGKAAWFLDFESTPPFDHIGKVSTRE